MRALWKGVVRFGGVRVPVKLYSAAVDRTVHFRLLHDQDHVPVVQRMIHPGTGEVVAAGEIRRGYPLEDGTFVALEPDELKGLAPVESREIEIVRFIPSSRVGDAWYDRPYHLGPAGEAATYYGLVEVLRRKGCEGVARWVMRRKAYRGALWSSGRHLMLITLRPAGEVIPAAALPAPGGRELDAKELSMAEQLVSVLAGRFDPSVYRDEYRARVLELIDAKARGRKIEFKRMEKKPPERSLARALRASVERARRERAA